MITEITIVFAKLILSSALLLTFYFLVLRSKASYKMQRLYLLLIPFASIMMSGFSLEVYKPEAKIIEMDKAEVQEFHSANAHTGYHIEASGNTDLQNLDINPFQDLSVVINEMSEEVFVINIALYSIAAVSVILLLIAAFYIFKIYKINKHLKAEKTEDGYMLVCSEKIKTAFSFGNTIYMPSGMESDKADYILMHEKAHIANKHYIDVWMIEFITRILWFNPFMWSVRKQLRNVHEYEADRSVIDAGANMLRYQTILLEEVAEDSVIIANGFNHSFIRRRFLEMKKKSVGKLGFMGKAGMGLWVLILFCGFTFTIGKAETIIKYVGEEKEITSAELKEEVLPIIEIDNLNAEEDTPEEDDDKSTKPTNSTIEYEAKTDVVEYASDGYPYIDDIPLNTNKSIQYSGFTIKRTPSETLVTCVGTCESDDDWFWFGGDQTYIEDADTGTHYKARRCTTPLCWNSFHVRNHKGKTFAITMVFPPIADNVKYIKLWHLCSWLQLNDLILPLKDYEVK